MTVNVVSFWSSSGTLPAGIMRIHHDCVLENLRKKGDVLFVKLTVNVFIYYVFDIINRFEIDVEDVNLEKFTWYPLIGLLRFGEITEQTFKFHT